MENGYSPVNVCYDHSQMKNLAGGAKVREVIAAICVVFPVLIPGSAFAYWVPDSYGQGLGPGLPGPQGGYLGDNPGPSLVVVG